MLKILQARLKQYVNHELPDVQAGFRKDRGTRDQIASICWIIKKAREFQKNICFIDYAKAFDCVDHKKLWQILQGMGIPDYLTCLWEGCMQVKKQQLEVEMEQQTGSRSGKEDNLYAEYIMRNAGLDEAQAGIKIVERNTNYIRYADCTILMAESEELKSLLMKVKEESEKVSLKFNIQKTKIMACGPITLWQIDGETVETEAHFILGAPKSLQPWN